jgi:hypothetical protein
LTPILFALAPAFAHLLPGSETVHRALVFCLATTGLLAFRSGYKIHRLKIILALLGAGLLTIAAGAFAGGTLFSHRVEIYITLTGSVLLIAAHGANRTFCRNCQKCSG